MVRRVLFVVVAALVSCGSPAPVLTQDRWPPAASDRPLWVQAHHGPIDGQVRAPDPAYVDFCGEWLALCEDYRAVICEER